MSLLGLPLFLSACAVTVGAFVALALLWRRLRGWWRPVRIVGVMLCQLLVVSVLGLAINRSDGFYPSWEALFGNRATWVSAPQPPALLAKWLRTKQALGARSGLSFPWHGDKTAIWHLQAPPTVFLPRAYFRQPARAVPVVVVLFGGDRATAPTWDDTHLMGLAAAAPAVIVLVHPDAGPDARLAAELPNRLAADLRVMRSGWGLIGVGQGAPAAIELMGNDPGTFGSLALLGPLTGPTGAQARALAGTRLRLSTRADDPVGTLRWVYSELPAALAPPLVFGSSPANPMT